MRAVLTACGGFLGINFIKQEGIDKKFSIVLSVLWWIATFSKFIAKDNRAKQTDALVGSFGWRNELPKNHYKYTLLYTTNKNISTEVRPYLKNNNYFWSVKTKKYYRLIYEFDVE